MELYLNEAERELLDEILRERHMILQHEIDHTSVPEFRRMLHTREKILEDIIERVEVEETAPADAYSSSECSSIDHWHV